MRSSVFSGVAKYIYFSAGGEAPLVVLIVLGVLLAVIATACATRLGYISYLEAMLVAALWFFFSLILDFVILSIVLKDIVQLHWETWLSYLVLMLSIFLFHKKQHIQRRHAAHAHH